MKLTIFTDGGARGNPGPAGSGAVIFDEQGKKLKELKQYLGEQTNNFAEYSAILMGLEEAKKMGAEEVEMFMDSELAAKQLNREYRIKNAELGKLFVKIYNLEQNFRKVNYSYIPREANKQADRLANLAMDREDN